MKADFARIVEKMLRLKICFTFYHIADTVVIGFRFVKRI